MGAEGRWRRSPARAVGAWVHRLPPRAKAALAAAAAMAALVFLRLVVRNHHILFMASETAHTAGIVALIYKLSKGKTCAGLSLKSQELTAIFLAVRLYCSFIVEYNVHTLLDSATLMTTLWVVYMIRYVVRPSYMEDNDSFSIYFVVIPCALVALIIHPRTRHNVVVRILWAFSLYLESVSVLPQLHVMQNTKIVEPFTAHYVFGLGVAQFFSCAHWIIQFVYTRGTIIYEFGYGPWPATTFLSKIVQTLIFADFCYYYVKSFVRGDLVVRLPSNIV